MICIWDALNKLLRSFSILSCGYVSDKFGFSEVIVVRHGEFSVQIRCNGIRTFRIEHSAIKRDKKVRRCLLIYNC